MMNRYTASSVIKNKLLSADLRTLLHDYETHWHDYFEIEYILSGSGEYIIDNVSYEIAPGMLFFMTPANFHCVKPQNAKIYNVIFSGSIAKAAILSDLTDFSDKKEPFAQKQNIPLQNAPVQNIPVQNSPAPVVCLVPDRDKAYLEGLFSELTGHMQDPSYAPLLLNCLLCKIGKLKCLSASGENVFRSKALLYLLNHFRDAITLEEAAAYTGLTPTYFSRLFKEETGCGFKETLDDMRFSYAHKLLTFSDMAIAQICQESGFTDYANFIRRFGKRFGMSPGQYRQTLKGRG